MEGRAAYVAKEKLKMLKNGLKRWCKEHVANYDQQINEAKEELDRWDMKGERSNLSPSELEQRRDYFVCIQKMSRAKCSMLWQKSMNKLPRDGDTNSRYFHGYINKRRKSNEILFLSSNGRNIVEVEELRDTFKEHFRNHFASQEWERPSLQNLEFKKIQESDNVFLTAPFIEDEVKEAVWDCESSMSPGPDE